MLRKFSVSNFKNFDKEITLDLSAGRYDFNTHCIKNKIVNTAVIFGYNASGKSNFALALFDIVSSITDYNTLPEKYANYQHIKGSDQPAVFTYEFQFGNSTLSYSYEKQSLNTPIRETVTIDNEEMLRDDRTKDARLFTTLDGAQSLTGDIQNPQLSAVKFVKSNANLNKRTKKNETFLNFIDFVDRMLLFWCLQSRSYIGFDSGTTKLIEDLARNKKLDEYNSFLTEIGLNKNIVVEKNADNSLSAYYDYGEGHRLPYEDTLSNGESALLLFFFWFIKLKNPNRHPSLFFVDEFDAFYHIEVSRKLIDMLSRSSEGQVILTSHNTSIIDNDLLRPDCYYLLDDGSMNSFQNLTGKELRKTHNIERLYRSGAFE